MVSKSLVMLGLLAPASAFVSRAPIVRTATVARSKHVVKVRGVCVRCPLKATAQQRVST